MDSLFKRDTQCHEQGLYASQKLFQQQQQPYVAEQTAPNFG